ncbi:MAG: lipopolysaccharide biosynthesis protein [Candidatus Omnitrophica bacterium]|nr:lipopolysaccharide biosynthesis protein [Candidatus Omnitrophota bacterium]MBU1925755.1 lipopolysaccharide biosynthesis protein [Candidatus Omnitrophota bacterium]
MIMNIRQKIVQGFTWITLGEFFSRVIHFIATIVLARLLLPEHFGTIATACIYINFIQMLHRGIGLSEAIIQGEYVGEQSIATAFFAYFFIGTIFSLVTLLIAPFIAEFFNNNSLTLILRILSLIFIFDALTYIFEAVLSKRLEYRKIILPQLGGIIAYSLIGNIAAYASRSVWSLVWALLFKSVMRCFLSWRISRWQPIFAFKIASLRKMFKFGKNVLGTAFFHHVTENLDFLIIGKFLGVAAIGYYFFAYSIANYFYQHITPIFFKVLFPAFSQGRNGNKLFKEFYLKIVQSAALFSVPLYLGSCVNAKELVVFLFGVKWLKAALLVQILCINGLAKTFHANIARSVLFAKGRPDILCRWGGFYCLLNCVCVLVGLRHGITGVAAAVTIAEIIYAPVIILLTNRMIKVTLKTYIKNLKPVIVASLIAVSLLVCLNILLPEKIEYFLLKIVSVTIVYISSLKMMRIDLWQKIKFLTQ